VGPPAIDLCWSTYIEREDGCCKRVLMLCATALSSRLAEPNGITGSIFGNIASCSERSPGEMRPTDTIEEFGRLGT
jgi:hypothetical protein